MTRAGTRSASGYFFTLLPRSWAQQQRRRRWLREDACVAPGPAEDDHRDARQERLDQMRTKWARPPERMEEEDVPNGLSRTARWTFKGKTVFLPPIAFA